MIRVVVLGATGFIGRNVAHAFAEDPAYSVAAVRHRRPAWAHPRIEWREADLTSADDVARALAGAEIVVHAAAATAGAGANIALAADLVFAARSASFIQAFSKIGLIPDSGGTFFLPRLIGMHRASALMMTGDKVSAKEAEAFNMIYTAVEPETYETFTADFVSKLALMPTRALALTKKAVQESWNNTLSEQLNLELALQVEAGNTEDFKEGVQAFLDKRKPNFTGK